MIINTMKYILWHEIYVSTHFQCFSNSEQFHVDFRFSGNNCFFLFFFLCILEILIIIRIRYTAILINGRQRLTPFIERKSNQSIQKCKMHQNTENSSAQLLKRPKIIKFVSNNNNCNYYLIMTELLLIEI